MSKTVDFSICGDNLTELDETINLRLTNPSFGVQLFLSAAVLTINDTASQFKNRANIAINGGGLGAALSIDRHSYGRADDDWVLDVRDAL